MNQLARLSITVLLLTVCTLLPCAAQQRIEFSPVADQLFKEGVARYSSRQFREASALFDKLVKEYPFSHRVTAASVMKGKALYEVGENLECAKTLKAFLAAYPASSYGADARLTLGLVYDRIGRYKEASDEFLGAWRQVPQPAPAKLMKGILRALDSIIDRSMTVPTVERLAAESTTSQERAYLWLKVAEKEIDQENPRHAGIAVDTLMQRYGGGAFPERLAMVRVRLSGSSNIKLAALLPLMRKSEPSASKQVANDVYDGIVYAVEQYAKDPSVRIKVALETRDTERDPRVAVQRVQELAADNSIIGIIGPIFSATASAAAIPAQTGGVPLISPTANGNGIAAAGEYIFQANPDYETRGRAMARYAVGTLGVKTVATLAPSDAYGKYLAEGFVREASRLGAKVITQQWYQRGASDLKSQFANMRRAGMSEEAEAMISFAGKMKPTDIMRFVELGVPKKRLDSLMSRGGVIRATDLLGPGARARLDSAGLSPFYDLTKVDSVEYPVRSIQAIYVPISESAEVGVVSSQLVYFNFVTQLLGSGEWNDLTELHDHRRYCSGVVFDLDSYPEVKSGAYREFVAGFSGRFKKNPSTNALYGYDTAQLVLQQIRNGAATRTGLMKSLGAIRDYRGLHSRIGFSAARVNQWLPIVKFNGDTLDRIDEIMVE
jgi:ABC-type branched-subunit amino acid transport system substrate-binding protein